MASGSTSPTTTTQDNAAIHRHCRLACLRSGPGPEPGALCGPLAQATAFTPLNPHVYLDTVLLVGSIGALQPAALLLRHALPRPKREPYFLEYSSYFEPYFTKIRLMTRPTATALLIWQAPGWPRLTAPAAEVATALLRARQRQGELIGQCAAVGLDATAPTLRELWVQEAMATSAIEGEALNPDSVRSSVLRHLGLESDASAPVSRQVDGLVDVMEDATQNFADALDKDRLCRWHAALFPTGASGLRRIRVGAYRDHEDPMQIVSGLLGREVVHYTAPPSSQMDAQMSAFLDWFERTRPSGKQAAALDGIARAAIAHLWFESIHPFEDGNGRIGRAIIDLALAQDAAAPQRLVSLSHQLLAQRRGYYDALQAAQHGNTDVSAWVLWFVQQYMHACNHTGVLIQIALEKSRFWAHHAGVVLNARQRKVVQRLLDDGDGGFLGGLNAQKYIKMTGASKATATRDLAQLVDEGLLFTRGQGKALRYFVNVPGWAHADLR